MSEPSAVFGLYDWNKLPAPRLLSAHNVTATQQLVTGIGLIQAVTICAESTTVPAKFYLYDGTDQTGLPLAAIQAPAGGSQGFCYGVPGLPYREGIYLRYAGGVYSYSVVYIPLLNQL